MTTHNMQDTDYVNLSGIEYEVEYTAKVTVDENINSTDVDVEEILNVYVNCEPIIWTDYTYQGRPLIDVLEERVR